MADDTVSTVGEHSPQRRRGIALKMTRHRYWTETYPRRQCEWMLALVMFGAGFIYAFADAGYRLPLVDAQANVFPRWAWASGLLFVGFIRLAFLTINGFYKRSPHFRALGAGLASVAWLQLTIASAQTEVAGASIAVWPVFFFFDLRAAINAAGEARTSDDLNRMKANGHGNDRTQ